MVATVEPPSVVISKKFLPQKEEISLLRISSSAGGQGTGGNGPTVAIGAPYPDDDGLKDFSDQLANFFSWRSRRQNFAGQQQLNVLA